MAEFETPPTMEERVAAALGSGEMQELCTLSYESEGPAALLKAANGVADGDVAAATRWLQQKLGEGGVASLETAVSQLSG